MDIPRATSFFYFVDGLTYFGFSFYGVLLRVGKAGSDGVEGTGLLFLLATDDWGYGSVFLVFCFCEGTVCFFSGTAICFIPFKWRILCGAQAGVHV